MKRNLLFIPVIILFFASIIALILIINDNKKEPKKTTAKQLREKYQYFLDNSPYKKTKHLGRQERKALGLPPNAFFEQEWDRTLDPNLGYPNYQKALKIQHQLIETNKNKAVQFGVPGESVENPWVERGPNNAGGRTRGILYDPNDASNRRIFAGGVSGGLWVNNDITDVGSVWQLVEGVPENIAVNQFAVDPNDSNIIYIASGESYTQGNAIGNGVYRSIDGGVNWEMIFGGPDGTTALSQDGTQIRVEGIFYVNDIITRNVNGSTEVYFAATLGVNVAGPGVDADPLAFLGFDARGVYRSTDNGDSWTRLTINSPNSNMEINPNDLELDINNDIWMSTTSSFGISPGGEIYRSSNGTSFSFVNDIPDAARTEIEPSSQNANVFYIAANVNGEADLFLTNDSFASIRPLQEPNDADTGVSANDYARDQAFFNLPIESDPNDDTILYVGGINTFRGIVNRSNNTVAWQQISRQNEGFVPSLDISVVHADIHAIVFNPSNSNEAILGTDGGIYYARDLATSAVQGNTNIEDRNNGYNVTQFFAGDIDERTGIIGAGSQDNGTQYSFTPVGGTQSFFDITSGDGTFAQFDDEGDYFIGSTQFINYTYFELPITTTGAPRSAPPSFFNRITSNLYSITDIGSNNRPGGNFVNEAIVDTNLDILYINATEEDGPTQIGRYSSFQNGRNNIVEETLTNQFLTGTISSFQVSPFTTGSTRLLVGNEQSRLLNIDDANVSPTYTVIPTDPFVGAISDIEFGINEDIIMITISNYGVESVFYTEDGGNNWISKEGNLPDIPVFSILQSPFNVNEVIVGTQFGVWRTQNFLDTDPIWEQSFNGMSNVPVRDLDLRLSRNEVLATTHGRGMFTGRFTGGNFDDPDNITVDVISESCPGLANGIIDVTVNAIEFNYTATLTDASAATVDEPMSFSTNTSFADLPVGAYTLCVSVDGEDFETCFEINIAEAEALDLDFSEQERFGDESLLSLSINTGTAPFDIRFNGELIRTTSERDITLTVQGSGTLEVESSLLCEGVLSFEINSLITDITAFPNPVINDLTITIPGDISSVPVSVFSITGQLVYQENSSVSSNSISIPFTNMSEGVYFVRLDMKGQEEPLVIRIIK